MISSCGGNGKRACRETLEKARDIEQTLQRMWEPFGRIGLPTEASLTKAYDRRIGQLESLLVRVPLTLNHVHRAMERVIAHLPPSGPNNEQFRDTLIWEAVLTLASTFEVHFITADKGFSPIEAPTRDSHQTCWRTPNRPAVTYVTTLP